MGEVLEVFPEQRSKPMRGTWYAVMHLFTEGGTHFHTQHFRQSEVRRDSVHFQLSEMIRCLRAVSFEDIAVAPFDTKIDGTLFGLVDVSDPVQGVEKVELRPAGISFSAPWTGIPDEERA